MENREQKEKREEKELALAGCLVMLFALLVNGGIFVSVVWFLFYAVRNWL